MLAAVRQTDQEAIGPQGQEPRPGPLRGEELRWSPRRSDDLEVALGNAGAKEPDGTALRRESRREPSLGVALRAREAQLFRAERMGAGPGQQGAGFLDRHELQHRVQDAVPIHDKAVYGLG